MIATSLHRQNQQHRKVLECSLGRELLPSEEVDHIDHNFMNNHPLNLRPVSRRQNSKNARSPHKQPTFEIQKDGQTLCSCTVRGARALGFVETDSWKLVRKEPTELRDETWRPVRSVETPFEVSSHGRIRRVGSKRPTRGGGCDARGYRSVLLPVSGKRIRLQVSRLIAEEFCPVPPGMEGDRGSLQVDHVDGDPTNNKVSNLEWVTLEENLRRKGSGRSAFKFWFSAKLPVL